MASSVAILFSWCRRCTFLVVAAVLYLLFSSVDAECEGPKGGPGPVGDTGPQGTGTDDTWYDILPTRNWRQCVFDNSYSSDSGAYGTCQIYKESSSTSLYAAWGGTTRIVNCHGCCGRWYFTFNNAECSNPQKIEGLVYMANYNGADLHRHRTIQGYCNGISAGWVDVTLNVGNCASYGSVDRHTGWNAISRIIVEEVPASPYG